MLLKKLVNNNLLLSFIFVVLFVSLVNPINCTEKTAEFEANELRYIANNPTVKIANEMDWPPFDFSEENIPRGYSIDLIKLVLSKVGLKPEFVNGFTWSELMEKFKQGEIDIMPAMYESEDRKKTALFTRGYYSQPSILVVNINEKRIQSLTDLKNNKVAVIRGFMISDILIEKYPSIKIVPVVNVLEGIKAVSTGDADAFIDGIGVVLHVTQNTYIPNIKILTDIPLVELNNPPLHIAVPKEKKVLFEIIKKGLAVVTPTEREELRKKWLHIPEYPSTSNQIIQSDSDTKQNKIHWWVILVIILVIVGLGILSRIIDRPVTSDELERMSRMKRLWFIVTFSNLKISAKILIILVLVAITSVVLFGVMSYQQAQQSLMTESFNKLTAVREMKAQQIENYYGSVAAQVTTFSESRTVTELMKKLKKEFVKLDKRELLSNPDTSQPLDDYYKNEFLTRLRKSNAIPTRDDAYISYLPDNTAAIYLQQLYISQNENPIGEKFKLVDPGDGSGYSEVHSQYHPIIRRFLEEFGYYDIFLVDNETGNIVYSVFKEIDFATSLLSGPFKNSNIATAFRSARNADEGEFYRFEDFEPYTPSYNAPASFISTPIFDGEEKIGVLIFQMPVDKINSIMTSQESWSDVGLGESGETYIIGSDYLMRNQSRFLIEDKANYIQMIKKIGLNDNIIAQIDSFNTSIKLQPVKTKGTIAALSGEVNTSLFEDYRGVKVLSSYRPLNIQGANWVIMSEIDESEALKPAKKLRNNIIFLMIIFLAGILVISFIFSKAMTRPIKILTAKANALASGDLGVSIEIRGGDEISQLGRSFDAMRKALAELIGGLEEKVEERTKELASKTEMLETTIESLTHPFYVINVSDYSIALMNTAAGSFEKNKSVTCHQLTHHSEVPCEGSDDPCPLEIVKKTKKPIVVEHIHYDKEGNKRFAEVHGYPIFDEKGNVVQMIEYSLDITDRKEADLALKKQFALNKSLVNTLPNPVFVKDTNTQFVLVNKSYEEAFGIDRQDYINNKVIDLSNIKLEARTELQEEDEEILKTGGMRFRETEIDHIDGTRHTMLYWITRFELDDGTIGGLVGILVDITEQKKLEKQLEKANARMGQELSVGHEIQMSMLPLLFPALPKRQEIAVFATLQAAYEVGGDFYDYYFIDDDWFFFCVGDVSDKGVPAALFMAVTKTLIKSRAADDRLPMDVMTRVNEELSADNPSGMFVTVLAAVLNVHTGELHYTSAGHNPPYLKRANGSLERLDRRHGPVIGAVGGIKYKEDILHLKRGDVMYLYTDGVTEAKSPKNELFTEKRLVDFLQDEEFDSVEQYVESTIKTVEKFQGKDQSDDITVLALQFLGEPSGEEMLIMDITIQNRLEDIDIVDKRISILAEEYDLQKKDSRKIRLSLDDLLNNIISYAYDEKSEHEINVKMFKAMDRLKIIISDDGKHFNPFSQPSPDIDSALEDREIGGLGIHLVRNLMSKVSYHRDEEKRGKNIITLVKHLKEK